MGGSLSYMKKLWRRITKGYERDRWIRTTNANEENRSLLSNERRRPNYRAIPPRIDPQVIIDSHIQDLPRKLCGPPSPNFHTSIHEQQISRLLYPFQPHRPSTSSFQKDEKNESDEHEWMTSGRLGRIEDDEGRLGDGLKNAANDDFLKDPVHVVQSTSPEPDNNLQLTTKDTTQRQMTGSFSNESSSSEDSPTTPQFLPDSFQREVAQIITEYRREMEDEDDEEETTEDDEDARDERVVTPASYQLERYNVPVHTFSSDDASWIGRYCPK